jgi:hypothetical protein
VGGSSSLIVPCPWPSTSRWKCNDPTLQLLVVTGFYFGPDPTATGSPPSPVSQFLDYQPLNGNGTAAPQWIATAFGAAAESPSAPLYIYSWSDTQIVAYTHATSGEVRVRLTNTGWDGSAQTAESWPMLITASAPTVTYVSGDLYDVPTTGGDPLDPLIIQVTGLDPTSDYLTVSVCGYNATLLTGVGSTALTPAAQQAGFIQPFGSPTTFYVLFPPGQGTFCQIVVNQVTPATGEVVPALFYWYMDYSYPTFDNITLLQSNGSWVTWQLADYQYPTVPLPTNGTVLRLVGANLGVAPSLSMWPSWNYASPRMLFGAGVPCGPAQTCYEFRSPPGQGTAAYAYSWGYTSIGFTVELFWGTDDTSPYLPLYFVYNTPTVTGIVSSSGSVPTTGGGGSGDVLYIHGYDFGVPIAALGQTEATSNISVSFYRPQDVGGINTSFACAPVTRISHTLMTCPLPPGSGANLTVHVSGVDVMWASDSTPT